MTEVVLQSQFVRGDLAQCERVAMLEGLSEPQRRLCRQADAGKCTYCPSRDPRQTPARGDRLRMGDGRTLRVHGLYKRFLLGTTVQVADVDAARGMQVSAIALWRWPGFARDAVVTQKGDRPRRGANMDATERAFEAANAVLPR